MFPLVGNEIRTLVEDFIAARKLAAEEGPVLLGEGAVGLDALALVVVEGFCESLRDLFAEDERDHSEIFRPKWRLVFCIEGIIKVLLILDKKAQIEGIEALKHIFPLLHTGTGPICEGAPFKAEGWSFTLHRSGLGISLYSCSMKLGSQGEESLRRSGGDARRLTQQQLTVCWIR